MPALWGEDMPDPSGHYAYGVLLNPRQAEFVIGSSKVVHTNNQLQRAGGAVRDFDIRAIVQRACVDGFHGHFSVSNPLYVASKFLHTPLFMGKQNWDDSY